MTKISKTFKDRLEIFDIKIVNYPQESGLIFLRDKDYKPQFFSEYIALKTASKYEADAVYFRRFGNGRPPIPQIFIYNLIDNDKCNEDIANYQKVLWNTGQIPLLFFFRRDEVIIFDCYKTPKYDEKQGLFEFSPLEIIDLAANTQQELQKRSDFSAKRFDNGSFWDIPKYKNSFNLSDTAYETLLNHLIEIRGRLIDKKILPEEIIQKLLVMSILLKYLEERKDGDERTVFPKDFFSAFSPSAKSSIDVFRKKGACLNLFDYLSKHFNGEIFKWEEKQERILLKNTDLTEFADFFEAKTEVTGQRTFWPLYSFNDLPIELISNIYEEFLGSKKGVVYTPPFLVNFLLDESMPKTTSGTSYKILDPTCGSGVFLVAAYRRMIYRWRINNNGKRPSLKTLKMLLKDNIYGVDKDPEAIRLTIFSLSLALCDELSSKVIWEELKFEDLQATGNLHNYDFFELINAKKLNEEFDLVIGNPPFIAELTTLDSRKIEEKRQEERAKLPDNQIALLFLEQAITCCKKNALLCLILPSGPFLYNQNSSDFRRYFLKKYYVNQILDFTPLINTLFGKSNVATLCIFARNKKPNTKKLLHVTIRRTKPSENKLYFEIDHYDFHTISFDDALNNIYIWKTNLLGGGRLCHLISRFASMRKLGSYLKEKEKNEGWMVGEGYIVSNEKEIEQLRELKKRKQKLSSRESYRLRKLRKRCKKAKYLTGKNTLPIEAFTEKGIDLSKIHLLKEKYFYRSAENNKKIFDGPHVLIKEVVGKHSIPIAYRSDFLSFKNSIIGIYAPPKYRKELMEIENRIKNKRFFLFFLAATSGRYMINKASSLLKTDIENLPFPVNKRKINLSIIEKILIEDVLDYILDFHTRGENSKAVMMVRPNQMQRFAETFCKIINSVYKKFKPYPPIETNSFFCFPFYYGRKPKIKVGNLNEFESNLNQLIYRTEGLNLRLLRVLRIYENNVIYLIKPKQLRYWLRSVAIRDADETFSDLFKQGY